MAAGDLITLDYQFEVNGLLFGPDTDIGIDRGAGGVGGLFDATAKSQDTDLSHAPGAVGGRDYADVRVVTFALSVRRPTAALSMTTAMSVVEAFNPASADVELHGQWPGLGRFYLLGRTRGVQVNTSRIAQRDVRMLATFVAQDPTIHTIEES